MLFRKKKKEKKQEKFIDSFIIAVVIALVIKGFFLQTYTIPSESMYDTLLVGDYIILNRLAYKFGDIERQDVVVFEYPLDPAKDFIKRVIGTPGDKIAVVNKTVFVNGKELDEPYKKVTDRNFLPETVSPRDNVDEFTVPEGMYFMMGDNRDNSFDSRFWGFVQEDSIKGKALLIYWSLKKPNYDSVWSKPFLKQLRFFNPAYDRFGRIFRFIH